MDNKKQSRKLHLNRETVRELSTTEMEQAAGGQAIQSLVPTNCCTGYYPSINAPCLSRAGAC